MAELVFVHQPREWCAWIVYPFLIAGDPLAEEHGLLDSEKIEYLNLDEEDFLLDEHLAEKVHQIHALVLEGKKIYLYDSGDYRLIKTFLVCFIQCHFNWNLSDAMVYVNSCLFMLSKNPHLTTEQTLQIERYKRPLTVLICGDRNSSICFENMIEFELKMLPKYSVIVHGGCKGVDLYAADLAKFWGFETREYSAEWALFGRGAGPIRNKQMLDTQPIDLVLAFHPDISTSRGTKNMMVLAHKKGIPVYIHDLKRKMKFEGDFEVL